MGTTATNQGLTDAEARACVESSLPGWCVEDSRLRRVFEFEDFGAAMAFMVEVAFHAERLCHHPNWSNVYGRVEVSLWSHDLGCISTKCVELARAMNDAAQ